LLHHVGLEDVAVNRLRTQEMHKLERLQAYRFAPAGTFGYARAEVTRGGVDTDEIDPRTMESQKISGLYFVGEVLDVTGRLGGYNLQWAWSTASVCARAINNLL
jgi:predicted flavoprotein YhiN